MYPLSLVHHSTWKTTILIKREELVLKVNFIVNVEGRRDQLLHCFALCIIIIIELTSLHIIEYLTIEYKRRCPQRVISMG